MSSAIGVGQERLEVVENLQRTFRAEDEDLSTLYSVEQAMMDLHSGLPVVPTIGCEIEVKHSSVFPDLMNRYFGSQDSLGRYVRKYSNFSAQEKAEFGAEITELEKQLLPKYEQAASAGVPRKGKDAFWEFSNDPAFSYATLAKEVEILFKAGLIPRGGHSLHITLGSMALVGGGPGLLACGLELVNGASDRIRLATVKTNSGASFSWARKGSEGMLDRINSDKIQLGHLNATEFRTLQAANFESTTEILRTSQVLGSFLLASRSRDIYQDEGVFELAREWDEYRATIKKLFNDYYLPFEPWGDPSVGRDTWLSWANLIDQSYKPGQLQDVKEAIREQVEVGAEIISEMAGVAQ